MDNRAAEIHDGLKHPVIDGDGHWMEPIPIFLEYLSEVGGAKSVDQMRALWRGRDAWYRATPEERQHSRLRRAIWWGVTSNTYDKATALLPALLNERLPELGIDFALIYPSFGLTINGITQDDLHLAACRAYNMMTADMFAPYTARFAPVAIIPSKTPDEALRELEYAVKQRGFKAIMLRGNQERAIPSAAEGVDPKKAAWYCDTIALDSPYDYEPLWQRCVDLGVAVTQHSGSGRWQDRASITNFTYNHVGTDERTKNGAGREADQPGGRARQADGERDQPRGIERTRDHEHDRHATDRHRRLVRVRDRPAPGDGDRGDRDDGDQRDDEPGDEQDLEPVGRLEGDIHGDRHQREQDERDDGEDDAGAGEPRRTQTAIEGHAGHDHPDRGDRGAERLQPGQRLAAQDDRQDDREAAVRRDHAAHDRDRADPEPREIGEVGARADQSRAASTWRCALGSTGNEVPATNEMMPRNIAQMSWTPAVTRRLPINRLDNALAMSIVPHERAAPRPVRSPKGIDAA